MTDAISRDAVCKYIAEFANDEYTTQSEYEMIALMIEGIQELPSVTQKLEDVLILKSDKLLHSDDRRKLSEEIKRGMENGVVILQPYLEPLLVPNDTEIRIEHGNEFFNFDTPMVKKSMESEEK